MFPAWGCMKAHKCVHTHTHSHICIRVWAKGKNASCQSILMYTEYRTHAVKSPSSMALICMNNIHTTLILLNSIGVHWNVGFFFSLSLLQTGFSFCLFANTYVCMCICKCFFSLSVLIYSWLSKNSDRCYFFSGPTMILKNSGDQNRTFQPTNANFNQSKLSLSTDAKQIHSALLFFLY